MEKLTTNILAQVISPRPKDSHKGTFGRVLVIGGSLNFGGAIIMSSQASIYAGAGLVSCATHRANLSALHARVPEAMFLDYHDLTALTNALKNSEVIVLGPGLDLDDFGLKLIYLVFKNSCPTAKLIIDGSAITLLSQHPELFNLRQNQRIIFTPHQMEWQRLSGIEIPAQTPTLNIQAQAKLRATIILKKAQTEIYHQTGEIHQLDVGGPYMATGGMGDTLTGILAAFLAQFKEADFEAVIDAATYLHSYAAQKLSTNYYVTPPSLLCPILPQIMQDFSQR